MATYERIQADEDSPSAVPRKNGELVFEAPWEGRAFGLAVVLSDRRVYDWEEFRARLIEEIDKQPTYYESWLAALEKLLLARGVVSASELDLRTAEYASGERDDDDHDHDDDHHEHEHDHAGAA
jgi:nitrile hydratase accessory protein